MTSDTTLTSRLLVPLDGSALAEQALSYVLALAGSATRIDLIQAIPSPEPRYDASGKLLAPIDAVLDAETTTATAELDKVVTSWGLPSDRTHVDVTVGEPSRALLEIAEGRESTLIVLSSHGRGATGRWRFGSVADRIVRQSPVPTLVARPGNTGVVPGGQAAQIDRLVVPLDGTTLAETALPVAAELAREMQLPVHLVRVVPPPRQYVLPAARPGTSGSPVPPVLLEYEQVASTELEKAREYLNRTTNHASLHGIATETDVVVGEPAPSLLDMTTPSDLVVMTSHGRGGVSRWLLGSVAEKLVRLATAPVLVVPDIRRMQPDRDAESGESMDFRELLLKDVYSPGETAFIVGTDVATVCQAAFRGELEARIINHDVVSIKREDLVQWLRGR